ncbi:putative alpha-galactosidase B [Halenospora varia]|nr:putative alpha-galactosidase B [Halenospora varia]
MHPHTLITTLLLSSAQALVLKDNVGKLPALGWNSWNAFHCDVNEEKIMTAANSIVSLGLKDAGYEYVNIDDCWSIKSGRDNLTHQIIPDPAKFPTGIKGTADKIHALGLKIGIYSSAGTETCAGYPASIGYESLDAATFAEWGIDYLKYDNCNFPSNWTDPYIFCVRELRRTGQGPNGTCIPGNGPEIYAPPGYDWSQSNTAARFKIMSDALLAQNRSILYSLCEWGEADVTSWGNSTGSSWRTTDDIEPSWERITTILNENSFLLNSVDFWGHNDPDMLEVGNGNLTLEENHSHFALWAGMKSPLIIGTALDSLPQELVDILKNKYLLEFSQDQTYGKPAMPYKWGTNPDWTFNASVPAEYWSGNSEKGVLVLAANFLIQSEERNIVWSEVPELNGKSGRGGGGKWGGGYQVTDIWSGEDLGCVVGGVKREVRSHDTVGFLVGERC